MKANPLHKVYQIHLLLNQAMYLFEELPEDFKFVQDNQELYEQIVKLCEDFTPLLEGSQNNNYTYTLGKLKKAIENVKIPSV